MKIFFICIYNNKKIIFYIKIYFEVEIKKIKIYYIPKFINESFIFMIIFQIFHNVK